MGKPIATNEKGICFAFPDVCQTPVGPAFAPVPYPNIGKLIDAENVSDQDGKKVKVGGYYVILKSSSIPKTMGDEAGTGGPGPGGKVEFYSASRSVKVSGEFVVRMTDTTTQNGGNAVGIVLGGVPNVLVGD